MHTSSRILTPPECDKIIANLDECLGLFERKTGMLNGPELRAKSLLSLMRHEIARERRSMDGSHGAFE